MLGLKSHLVDSIDQAIVGADAAVILVDHAEFKSLSPESLAKMRERVVIDTRNCLDTRIWLGGGFEIARLGSPQRSHKEEIIEYSLIT